MPVTEFPTGVPVYTATIGEILATYSPDQTRADATDVPGCTLEAKGGKWYGDLGTMPKATADALYASGALANLATGATYRDTSGTQYTYSAGAGWVGVLAGLNIDATAMIPDMRQSLLAGAPLQVTSDSVTAILGPTSQAQAVAEYDVLKTKRLEVVFVSGTTPVNMDKLGLASAFFVDAPYGTARLNSSPWPKPNGQTGWWSRGFNEYVVDGEGVIAISYARNDVNKCQVLIDGKILAGADSSGKVSNSVPSGGNAKQWCALTLVGDKRRVITFRDNPSVFSIVHDPGITVSSVNYTGNAIVFGDSFASRNASAGETGKICMNMAVDALRLLGYNVIDTATGGTGFVADGGGSESSKDSYSGYIDRFINDGVPLGFKPGDYSLIWLFGTGNDAGRMTVAAYLSVIQKALASFPNAVICITSVYEGFNSVGAAKTLNDLLYAAVQAAVQAAGPRVKWIPVDSYYKRDKSGIWSGTGSVPAPAYNGNADVYFSNATQGSADRHPNNNGSCYGAKYYAAEFIRAGVKYAPPQ